MSDGPYRSLPMKPAWKTVAKRLENENFDGREVAEAMANAIRKDIQAEVPPEVWKLLRRIVHSMETELFPIDLTAELANARRLIDGYVLGSCLLDCIDEAIAEQGSDRARIEFAVESAINDWLYRVRRQVEEHYLRHHESSQSQLGRVRQRFEENIPNTRAKEIAREFLWGSTRHDSTKTPKSGLDDGVPLQ